MSTLILLVLLVGGVLYLGGGLWHLYRYLQARRVHPQAPRLWGRQRRHFFWLTGMGVVLTFVFLAAAWWSLPGTGPGRLALGGNARQTATATGTVLGNGQEVAPLRPKVRGPVPVMQEALASSSTTSSASTTTTTSTTESTLTTTGPPAAKPAAKPPLSASGAAWTVCAASFRRESMAQNYARRLRDQGLPATVSQVDLGERGVWHRVCVGGFATLAEAKGQFQAWERQGLVNDAFLLPLR